MRYKVGVMKGIKSMEQRLPLYLDKSSILVFSDAEQGLKILQAGRIDLFLVSNQIEESNFMRSGAYKDIKCVGILETKVLYPWLHKRNMDLVRPLADTLKTMKSEGRF